MPIYQVVMSTQGNEQVQVDVLPSIRGVRAEYVAVCDILATIN